MGALLLVLLAQLQMLLLFSRDWKQNLKSTLDNYKERVLNLQRIGEQIVI